MSPHHIPNKKILIIMGHAPWRTMRKIHNSQHFVSIFFIGIVLGMDAYNNTMYISVICINF